jgi:hypothetical protein
MEALQLPPLPLPPPLPEEVRLNLLKLRVKTTIWDFEELKRKAEQKGGMFTEKHEVRDDEDQVEIRLYKKMDKILKFGSEICQMLMKLK